MERPTGALLIRHDQRCRDCRYTYAVYAWEDGPNWVAACANAECGQFRDCLDIAHYGERLGLPPERWMGKTSSIFEQSRGQKKVTRRVADGRCVHHEILGPMNVTRRGSLSIPRTWKAVVPTYQAQLLFEVAPPDDMTIPAEFSAASGPSQRDHIFQRQLHPHLASRLSGTQDILVRRHWIVPSCSSCNLKRAWSLEPFPYLIHLFALFIAEKGLTVNDCAEELLAFTDVAKTALTLLADQVAHVKSQDQEAR